MSSSPTLRSRWTPFVIAILLCQGVGILSGLATAGSLQTWYVDLVKPSFNPPSWVFGPVWTTLYLLMGIALARLWRCPDTSSRHRAIGFFLIQLVLNGLWSLVFFGAHAPGAALGVLIALIVSLMACMGFAWRTDRGATALLVPYLAWVSFAGVLNAALWQLN